MDIITTFTYEDLSRIAAKHVMDKIRQNPKLVIGLATGSTPTGMYQFLVEEYQNNKVDFNQITTFNLDEYVGIDKQNPNSYFSFMKNKLFKHINVRPEQTFIPDGTKPSLEKECLHYEQLLGKFGPVDIQILGLGENGHIGFNEPGTSFKSRTHIVELTPSTRNANARFFQNDLDVPTHAITMGIQSIMEAKEILLLVSGENKKKALHQLLYGEISESFPATILQNHPCVKIIADNEVLHNNSIIA
ncbi:glucosamine-6-phosphate deaminase [Sutcliffiella rhizosphaerae]|uniref:Glucosamine-6-phosphate deaminase n=1 Tax=Sutcliffiella rhizosphaerae TaxID=2880967 RepID=A0ABN8A4A2_9BACI|nr:glucosamine-6-phosphate deaminase [Sutcliffiella rhizosphaerae]CAG9619944.1 Glucosamine-6-phosphate deaminase 1 [Sutcliffiella rhizosphaerae]